MERWLGADRFAGGFKAGALHDAAVVRHEGVDLFATAKDVAIWPVVTWAGDFLMDMESGEEANLNRRSDCPLVLGAGHLLLLGGCVEHGSIVKAY